jgi:hypothetical protein
MIAASSRLVAVVRADTADALQRAAFRLVELTDDCWRGPRGIGSRTMSYPEYEEQVGPSSSITLQFGEDLRCGPMGLDRHHMAGGVRATRRWQRVRPTLYLRPAARRES